MDGPVIHIGWEYFLGIIAGLLLIAWYSSSRFTALETSMQWVRDILNDLKISADNTVTPAFGAHSPVSLNELGNAWIVESGFKEYIDANKKDLMYICEEKKGTNPYEVQKQVFKEFDTLKLKLEFDERLKKFAFDKGTTMCVLRRCGAIYFRDLCLTDFGMNKSDIDKHDPSNAAST